MGMHYRECSVCGIRCFEADDFFPLPAGGGYCNRCATVGGYDWLVTYLSARGHEVGRDGFALCPGHDDRRRPNLHVSRAERDPRDAVVYCHAVCHDNADQILGALGLSRWHLYHPANHPVFAEKRGLGSRVKDQGQRQDVRLEKSVGSDANVEGGSSQTGKDAAPDAMEERLDRFRVGLLEPVPVSLPVERLPRQAKGLLALVAEIELWMGLRLADFEYRPLPLSQRFVARRMGWWRSNGEPHDGRGWRALEALLSSGVLVPGEPLEARGHWLGTRTFKPPEPLATELGFTTTSEHAVEGEPGVVEGAVAEPDAELAQ
jgi:hypothetical protein